MATNAIFRNFTVSEPFRNKYIRSRGLFEIVDANLHHGDIRPFACPEIFCKNVGNYRSFYPLEECPCLGYEDVKKPVKGFSHDQYFYLRNGYLMQATTQSLCNGEGDCRAGVPFNPVAPVAEANCNGKCDGVAVSYVITYVTTHAGMDVEGPPSPASNPVASEGNIPNVTVSWTAAPDGFCIKKTRLYRVVSDSLLHGGANSQGSEFVLVKEWSGSNAAQAKTFTDNVASSNTRYPLMTYEPMAFPAPGNLFFVGRTEDCLVVTQKNRVFFSLPGKPQFTWEAVIELEDDVRYMLCYRDIVYLFTNKCMTIIFGVWGDSGVFKPVRYTVERHLPLTSILSVSVWDNKIFFASTYGLYSLSIDSRRSANFNYEITELISPEQWKNIDPYSVIGTAYEFSIAANSSNQYSSTFWAFVIWSCFHIIYIFLWACESALVAAVVFSILSSFKKQISSAIWTSFNFHAVQLVQFIFRNCEIALGIVGTAIKLAVSTFSWKYLALFTDWTIWKRTICQIIQFIFITGEFANWISCTGAELPVLPNGFDNRFST